MTSKQLAAVITDEQVLEAATRIVDKSGYSRGIVEVDNRTEEGGSVLRYIARPVRQSDAAALMIIIDDITQQRIAQEAQSSFVAQAAHELRNPLTTIRMVVETAIEDEDQSAEETAEALNIVNSEASRLANIVQDMLNVSEIEAGSLQRKDSDVVMTDIMTRLQRDLEPQAKAKKQQLKMDLPPKYPRLTGDPDKLQVALHNVASNAIKYTPEGGMVTISAEDVSGQLIIRIADTGIGIDPKEAEKIFDRFYRAQDRRLRGITGTGLGLGLARQIIRLHGGDITVESEIDQGSTFSITLPIHEGALMAKG